MSKGPPTVLMLGPDPSAHGGIASVICLYQKLGLIDGRNVRFVATFRTGSATEKLRAATCAFAAVLRDFSLGRVSVVHIHVAQRTSFYRKSLFVILAKRFGVPVILHLHSGEFERFYERSCGTFRKWYVRLIFRQCAILIALSNVRAAWLRHLVEGVETRVVFNPVALEAPKVEASDSRRPIVLFMGRLDEKKGIFDFVEALARLIRDGLKFEAWICGSGDVERVRASVSANGLDARVHLKGWVVGEEKTRILETAAVLVLPSYFEGQPMALLEAAMFRVAVVATNVGGIPDILTDGRDAILVEPGDTSAMCDAIRRLLESPQLRASFTESAFRQVSTKFAPELSLGTLRELYSELQRKRELSAS